MKLLTIKNKNIKERPKGQKSNKKAKRSTKRPKEAKWPREGQERQKSDKKGPKATLNFNVFLNLLYGHLRL
jgi:hypothetical protein